MLELVMIMIPDKIFLESTASENKMQMDNECWNCAVNISCANKYLVCRKFYAQTGPTGGGMRGTSYPGPGKLKEAYT